MFYPSKDEYLDKAKKYNLIPVYKEYMVDTETPASIFIRAGGLEREMFLLESVEQMKRLSRYSFIGVGISFLLKFKNGIFSIEDNNKKIMEKRNVSPLEELRKVMNGYHLYKNPELNHFVGGAVGYLSYDLVKYFDDINQGKCNLSLPEMMLNLTDSVIVFDHFLNRMKIISTIKIEKGNSKDQGNNIAKVYYQSIKKIEEVESKIFTANKITLRNNFSSYQENQKKFNFDSNFSKKKFLQAVEKAREYIIAGEAFQIVLSQRFSLSNLSEPFDIYRALRTTNPSPYMYYINFGKLKIIGSSPEPLIKVNGRKILTCPIAGTRKRGKNTNEDSFLIKSLLNDEKESAEHNMLVDLSRNDMGRICKFGSVKIKKYMSIEKYSHVIHMVSRIEGILDNKSTVYDALKSAFPAGTLTGAPKIRAMQLIGELEPDCRGPYGGVVGYFGYDGNLDTCIMIRTAIIKGKKAYVQAGAGVVYNSIPENEWNETLNKAGALFKAIKLANQV